MGNTLTRTHDLIAGVHERERLEREVISAAKAWERVSDTGGGWDVLAAMATLSKATLALNKFEAENKVE